MTTPKEPRKPDGWVVEVHDKDSDDWTIETNTFRIERIDTVGFFGLLMKLRYKGTIEQVVTQALATSDYRIRPVYLTFADEVSEENLKEAL